MNIDTNTIYLIIGSIIGLMTFYSMFFVVGQKTATIVEVLGKFSSVKSAGLNFKLPYPIGKIETNVNLQVRELKINIDTKSSNNAFLTFTVGVQYKVIDSKVKEAYYNLDNPVSQMKTYIVNAVKAKSSNMTMNDLFTSRNDIEDSVKKDLTKEFESYGLKIVNVLVDDPKPSASIIEASNEVLAAERKKDASVANAEALRIDLVGRAQADKEALILKGEAFQEYRALMANGNFEAMQVMMGTHKVEITYEDKQVLDKETGETTTKSVEVQKIVPVANPVQSDITAKDLLDFFAGIDQRETLKDIGRSGSTTFIIPSSFNDGSSQNAVDFATMNKVLQQDKKEENK